MTRRRARYEHELEDFAAARFAQAGHVLLKFASPGFPGVPDRIALSRTGRVAFIEFKAPGGPLRKSQKPVLTMLRAMGHKALVIDTQAQVEQLLQEFAS